MPRSLGFHLSSDSTSKVGKKALSLDQVAAVSSNTKYTIWTNLHWEWLSVRAKEASKVQSSHYLGERGRGREGERCWSFKFVQGMSTRRELFLYMNCFQHPFACPKLNTQLLPKWCTYILHKWEEQACKDKIVYL